MRVQRIKAAFLFALMPLFTLQAADFKSELTSEQVSPQAEVGVVTTNKINFKTEQVIVFKDGYTLVLKHGTARTDSNGDVFSDQVPEGAVLGSFWAIPNVGKMLSMKAGWVKSEEKLTANFSCTNHLDLLLANLGKEVTVRTEKNEFSGTLQQVLTKTTFENLSSWEHLEVLLAKESQLKKRTASSIQITKQSGDRFVLKTETGSLVLSLNDIKSLQIKEMASNIQRSVKIKSRDKRLTFHFKKPNQTREITLMYFRPGLRWIPTYRLQLDDGIDVHDENNVSKGNKSQGTIALQAEIVNEMEDLFEVPVKIVVGVPHFRFKNIPSPFVLESVLRRASGRVSHLLQSQSMMRNSNFDNGGGLFEGEDRPFLPSAPNGQKYNIGGKQSHDLFVYTLPKLTLKKGDRIGVPVFTEKTTYRDVYTWDLKVLRQDNETGPAGGNSNKGDPFQTSQNASSKNAVSSPLQFSKNQVWHQLDIRNETSVPWTTGPVMLLQGWQPLSQELLTYTSSGGYVRVPVTVAVDLRGTFDEKETERKLNALNWDHNRYAQIYKQAKVKIVNHKSKEIKVEIKVRLGGKVTQCSDEGTIKLLPYEPSDWRNYRGSPAVNNSSLVTWKVTLKAGETFNATVDYHYFARQ